MKLFFGILSLIPAVVAYVYYFRDMFSGKTKPHAFSWLIWGTLAGIGTVTQVTSGAGIGAWATGVTSIVSLTIFAVAASMGSTKPSRADWILLLMAMSALALLGLVDDKRAALFMTLFALVIGFAITIKKAWHKPAEENLLSFTLNTLKFVPAIFALSSFTVLTVAYPVVAAAGNAAVAGVVYWRRRSTVG